MAAGDRPEVHAYRAGGHGFGVKHQGTTSGYWIDQSCYWSQAQGLTRRRTQ